jgi:hypothetical protein
MRIANQIPLFFRRLIKERVVDKDIFIVLDSCPLYIFYADAVPVREGQNDGNDGWNPEKNYLKNSWDSNESCECKTICLGRERRLRFFLTVAAVFIPLTY